MSVAEKKNFHRLTKQNIFELVTTKTLGELKAIVNRPGYGFKEFLQDQKYFKNEKEVDFETFDILWDISSKMCIPRREGELGHVQKFVDMIASCRKFLFQDSIRVIHECLKRQHHGIKIVSLVTHFIQVLKTIMRHKLACSEYIIDVTFPALQNIMNDMTAKRIRDLDDVKKEFDYLKKLVDINSVTFVSEEDDDQVELFRQLTIMPRDDDVINCEVPDLPCNIVDGPYNSVSHYLSVHFRLMREDMLRNFRDCIKEHNNPSERNKSSSRTYEHVNVKFPPDYSPEGIGYKIEILTEKPVNVAKKEVLMPGNIVCLTNDGYKSVHFAIIRKEVKAEKGLVNEFKSFIKMEDTSDEKLVANVDYLMFETSAYFECYRHVLSALKEFNQNNLPLSDILVYLNFERPEPDYLVDPDQFKGVKYCLHEKCGGFNNLQESNPPDSLSVEENSEIQSETFRESSSQENVDRSPCGCIKFDPLNYNEWPFAEDLRLDEQQIEAFQTALTRKVAVIQGPPGTGKTYIGVKVVKALLQNLTLTPIVICCLTNHALDQFLEHIFNFTKNVVRLGSQSKSKILQPYTLENLIIAYNLHVREEPSRLLSTDNTIRESINWFKMFAPELLKIKAKNEGDTEFYEFKDVCNQINNFYRTFYLCKDDYLDDTSLNEIIGMREKNQLLEGASKLNSQILINSVLEWLCCQSKSELYDECDKRFCKFKSSPKNENISISRLWSLDLSKRFKLFFIWREQCLSILRKNIDDSKEEYKNRKITYRGRRPDPLRVEILQKAQVVGVTTTGAAKYRQLLRYAGPKILIVEEAAEVLESHIISSLLPTTQQLILIGDHKQLRPLPANNELSEVYNLKISMFERLFNNGAPSATLVSQHRMKPCIAELLVHKDLLYDDLKSDKSVQQYEDIKGVKSSMFFLNHNKAEDSMSSSTSSSNDYEACMVAVLAKYFIVMSYLEEQITIIATYARQVDLIQKYLKEAELNIFVTTVDNYQGEENDIIIVSFVRSNKSGLIGFLKENNRVCVALSRAKKGMFCFGNFSSYSAKSDLWANIFRKLESQSAVGPKLPLMCSKHDKETLVDDPEEIRELMRRGCDNPCEFQLSCGHKCTRKCHYNDPEHTRYMCTQPCEKYITETKKCPRMCYQRCKKSKKTPVELPCGHVAKYKKDDTIITKCQEEVQKILLCNHIDTLPCHVDAAKYKCKAAIIVVLPCGHKNTVPCYKSNDLNHVICTDATPRNSSCGHTVYVPCYMNLDSKELLAFCKHSCDQLLTCGHACTGDCGWCFDVGIHNLCTEKCDQRLGCGHFCPGLCGSPCLPCKKTCILVCSHQMPCINHCYRPCSRCDKQCERRCEHGACSNLCSDPCSVEPCNRPCKEYLPCGHQCIGLCGDVCPIFCRVCHEGELTTGNAKVDSYVELDCEHVIEHAELKEHIEMRIECFLFPDCPKCHEPITKSLRFKELLQKAKVMVLKSNDNSKETEEVYYLLNSMIGSDMAVPAEFQAVHQSITNILNKDKSTSGSLFDCVMFISDLMNVSKELKALELCEESVILQRRFETLLLWIYNHLESASYQQIKEIDKAIVELKKSVESCKQHKAV